MAATSAWVVATSLPYFAAAASVAAIAPPLGGDVASLDVVFAAFAPQQYVHAPDTNSAFDAIAPEADRAHYSR